MKGKKFNSEFFSNFISNCINNNKVTPAEMLVEAKLRVSEIDARILEIEKLRLTRGDLLDVIATFEKSSEKKENDSKQILDMFSIKDQKVCKFICEMVKKEPTEISHFYNKGYDEDDILFCLKQLLEHKIISKQNTLILRSVNFSKYIDLVFRDSE